MAGVGTDFLAARLGVKNAVSSNRGADDLVVRRGAVTRERNLRGHERDKPSGRGERVRKRVCHPG
jgi:hypothetical protein